MIGEAGVIAPPLFCTQNTVSYCQNTLLQTAFSAILPTGSH